jgi:hypothetical protein
VQARDPQQIRVAARADGRIRREGTQHIFEMIGKLSGQQGYRIKVLSITDALA